MAPMKVYIIMTIIFSALAVATIIGTWINEPEFGMPITILWLLLLTIVILDLTRDDDEY